MKSCSWPGCDSKLQKADWCPAHWRMLPKRYQSAWRTSPQPPELVQAALLWIESGMREPQRECVRCPAPIEPGTMWAALELAWPDKGVSNLRTLMCANCATGLAAFLDMRWCTACTRWVRKAHDSDACKDDPAVKALNARRDERIKDSWDRARKAPGALQ